MWCGPRVSYNPDNFGELRKETNNRWLENFSRRGETAALLDVTCGAEVRDAFKAFNNITTSVFNEASDDWKAYDVMLSDVFQARDSARKTIRKELGYEND